MKSSPILFSDPMIRAIRSGIKTQTRRLVKREALEHLQTKDFHGDLIEDIVDRFDPPHGGINDQMWVKECFGVLKVGGGLIYRADGGWAGAPNFRDQLKDGKWKPSIFMGRAQSRIRLEHIAAPRIERLQDISESDCIAEGVAISGFCTIEGASLWAKDRYMKLWDSINEKPGERWADNPFVWVYTFEVK